MPNMIPPEQPMAVSPVFAAACELRLTLLKWRRHMHMYPEPSLEEYETARYVAAQLESMGLTDICTGVGKTGVTCLIRGRTDGPTIALRADMDALEIEEKTEAEYASKKRGLMHACGHDGHTACLLGAGAILNNMRGELQGNVKLVFQPAEESYGGAREMVLDGCLSNPQVTAISGLHVDTDIQSGCLGIRRGYRNAQTDSVNVTVIGRSAHAATPHRGVDAISVAAQVLIAVQQFIARHMDSLDRKLVTFGIIEGGTRRNILAGQVKLSGTIRTLEPAAREQILYFLQNDLKALAGAMGALLEIELIEGYPPVVNDDCVVDAQEAAGVELVGAECISNISKAILGGEDFSFYSSLGGVPGAMCSLGVRDEKKGYVSSVHTNTFDFNDEVVLPLGAAHLALTAVKLLSVQQHDAAMR